MYKVTLAKWLSARLRTKWLWVRVPLQSLNTPEVILSVNFGSFGENVVTSFI